MKKTALATMVIALALVGSWTMGYRRGKNKHVHLVVSPNSEAYKNVNRVVYCNDSGLHIRDSFPDDGGTIFIPDGLYLLGNLQPEKEEAK